MMSKFPTISRSARFEAKDEEIWIGDEPDHDRRINRVVVRTETKLLL